MNIEDYRDYKHLENVKSGFTSKDVAIKILINKLKAIKTIINLIDEYESTGEDTLSEPNDRHNTETTGLPRSR